MTALVASLGLLLAVSAMAQTAPPASKHDGMSAHHQKMFQMMKDMTEEMTVMSEQMSQGDITSDQRKKMFLRMDVMSGMMHRMSGVEAAPAMSDPERKKQMDEMRKQMDEMMRTSPMKPATK